MRKLQVWRLFEAHESHIALGRRQPMAVWRLERKRRILVARNYSKSTSDTLCARNCKRLLHRGSGRRGAVDGYGGGAMLTVQWACVA